MPITKAQIYPVDLAVPMNGGGTTYSGYINIYSVFSGLCMLTLESRGHVTDSFQFASMTVFFLLRDFVNNFLNISQRNKGVSSMEQKKAISPQAGCLKQ